MFIECFSGLTGGGKSFFSTLRAAEQIAVGGIVFSNIKFEIEPWFNESYSQFMPSFWLAEKSDGCRVELHKDDSITPVTRIGKGGVVEYEYNSRGLRHFLRVKYGWALQDGQCHYISDEDVNSDLPTLLPKGNQRRSVLVILDEALDHFESSERGANANAEFRSFLRHTRKLGINICFIAQDFNSLEKKIRSLTHYVWRFRDLYSWPVPVFNRPLPAPWKNNIICEKYHQSQFGKLKAEPINKNTWIFRDPLIFGCYQSISLHNAGIKMADDMQTDFGDVGKIKKEGKRRMNWLERAALFLCLIMAGMGAFKSPAVVAGDAGQGSSGSKPVIEAVASLVASVTKTEVLYADFRFARLNGNYLYLEADGIQYAVGHMTTAGTVLAVSEGHVHIRDDVGNDTFIYPLRGGIDTDTATAQSDQGKGAVPISEVAGLYGDA